MRNDFIGTDIDGDARTMNGGMRSGCGCQHHDNACGCNREGRERECPCNERREGNGRGCCNDCVCPTINREPCHRTPAMVYAEDQKAENTYCADKALARGTLFPCLDKPMYNECNGDDTPCATRCQKERFTIWELRLYLDTHPCDQCALAMLREKCSEMDCDCKRMHCDSDSETRWDWLEEPWPWEFTRCCGREA